jgi:hypothetical protein
MRVNEKPRDYFKTAGKNESWWLCPSCGHMVYRITEGVKHTGRCGGCGVNAKWSRFIPGEVLVVKEELDVLVFNGVLDANW